MEQNRPRLRTPKRDNEIKKQDKKNKEEKLDPSNIIKIQINITQQRRREILLNQITCTDIVENT